MNNDLSLNSNRAGFLTIALVPFLLASTGRHSALALLTGMSSVRLNFFHRVLGIAIVLLATVHMACMVSAWAAFPSFMASHLYPIRVFKYEFFVCTHLLAFGFIGAISKHTPYAMRYFITGIVCYCLNLLASWFVQARLARVRAHVLPNDCTRLSLRLSSPIKHHPGQYIYVCIPRLSAFQWHPFTITNTQPTGEGFCDTLVEVHATVRGDYTRQLYKLAADHDDDWHAFVSGPCGRTLASTCPETMLTEQRVIVAANAGAGVTFGMRLIRELASVLLDNGNHHDGDDNDEEILDDSPSSTVTEPHPRRRLLLCGLPVVTRDIYFIWSVRRGGELAWFKSELQHYKTQFDKANATDAHFPRLHLLFYHTGTDDLMVDEDECMTEMKINGHSGVQAAPVVDETLNDGAELGYENKDLLVPSYSGSGDDSSKPSFRATIQRQRVDPKECLNLASGSESMGLFVCGSSSFNRSFKNSVAKLDASRSCLLEFHCEDFEY
ncbi:hypothetical protein BCR42DRAFT_412775 [Absidia repens]|uniref:FAD-binding FR-type domain-containing protein n=1 Tax=Absidia repens TaxID=90262 RepID=A0A1X2IK26_9FUNG|nr:hypothetical protein BCR42DRAFT_412775 [Absidia repens]